MPKKKYGERLNIGSEEKLRQVRKYLNAYVNVFKNQKWAKPTYFDLFAGSGSSTTKKGIKIDGSPIIALKTVPKFSYHIFCDNDKDKIKSLKKNIDGLKSDKIVDIYEGDANSIIIKILVSLPEDKKRVAFAFLDPQALDLNYSTIDILIKNISNLDLLINFPVGGLVRNLKDCRINCGRNCTKCPDLLFGNKKWREIAYPKSRAYRKQLLELYVKPLEIAGFMWAIKRVRNQTNTEIYDLIFASKNVTAMNIMRDVMFRDEPRPLFNEEEIKSKIEMEFRGNVKVSDIYKKIMTGDNTYITKNFQEAFRKLNTSGHLCRTRNVNPRKKNFDDDEIINITYEN